MNMSAHSTQILTIIPARMGSTRLPGKPLAEMGGTPMIVRVWQQALAAELGPVIVACAEPEIKAAIDAAGGQAVLTDPDLPSGSDRVRVAADIYDPDRKFDIILNLQGDMPLIDPDILKRTVAGFETYKGADIITAVTQTQDGREIDSPHIVKAVLAENGRALYFSRSAVPHNLSGGVRTAFHHVGLYAYRRAALTRFCELPPSRLELTERLEQLRALEDGMVIYAVELDDAPAGIDTATDLARANKILTAR